MTWVAVAVVGGSLLAGKIQSNRGQKAAIGSGTAPAIEPGAELAIAPVQGTEVQDFGAATEGFAEPEIDRVAQEQELIQQLIDAGYDPKELGLAGLAFGGPLYRSNGGGLPEYFNWLNKRDPRDFDPGDLKAQYNLQHIAELFDPTKAKKKVEPLMMEAGIPPEVEDILDSFPDQAEDSTLSSRMGDWWGEQDPELQSAIVSAGAKVLTTALFPPEQKGSLVSTQTLPGNAARRRAAQMNIKPIVGSSFADGGVLNRPMFMPKGGEMYGRGGPKDDLIPVMASNGEYMLSKAAVDQAGGGNHARGIATLEAFNNAGNKRYG